MGTHPTEHETVSSWNPAMPPQPKDEIFRALAERCWKKAFWIAYDLLGHAEEAEDLCQDALIRAYEHWDSFREESSPDTWFYRILTNLCLNHRRRRGLWGRIWQWLQQDKEQEQYTLRLPVSSHPERQYQSRQTGEAIQKAMERLSPNQRMVFVLRYLQDFSVREICDITTMSEGTVKTHISRALQTMREQLEGFHSP